MIFSFRTNFAVGTDVYSFGAGIGGAAPEPEPEVTTTMLRSPMRSVMRNPMAAVMSPRLRTEK